MKSIKILLLLSACGLAACNAPEQDTGAVELVGHRGITGLMPENTIPGFLAAIDQGVNGIELDVVVAGDQSVVITHEPWFRHDICLTPEGESISREEQVDYNMYEMTYEEIAEFDCGSVPRPNFPGQEATRPLSKPLMREAIEAMEDYVADFGYPTVDYYVEIKSHPDWDNVRQPEPAEVVRLVYEELNELGVLDRSLLMAFDVRILQAMKELDSTVPQVLLISTSKPDLEANLEELTYTPEVYGVNFNMAGEDLMNAARAQGMRVATWTVNETQDMQRMLDLGVDVLITDYAHRYNELTIEGQVQEEGGL